MIANFGDHSLNRSRSLILAMARRISRLKMSVMVHKGLLRYLERLTLLKVALSWDLVGPNTQSNKPNGLALASIRTYLCSLANYSLSTQKNLISWEYWVLSLST